MNSKITAPIVIYILILLSYSTSFSNTNGQELSLNEEAIIELQQQIRKLQTDISDMEESSQNANQLTTYESRITKQDPNDINLVFGDSANAYEISTSINSNNSIIDLRNSPVGGIFGHNGAINVGDAPAITTRGQVTFLGAYSGNNSIPIGMISGSLFSSTVIGQRNKFDDYAIFLGGKIEVDAQVWSGSEGISNGYTLSGNGQNISLTSSTLYFLANVGHYVTAQFDISTSELNNFGLGNAFVIFGNLDTSPLFVTAGRSRLSVGAFGGGGPWTGGITGFLAPGRTTNISLNYKDDILNANIAVFGSDDNRINFSTGLFYAERWTESLAVGFNTGYVFNIAGAGNASFSKFLESQNSSKDNIGSFNINGNLTYTIGSGFLNLGTGWASTTNRKDFNGSNQNVLAGGWYTAANYSLQLGGRNTNFGVSYGQTYNSANIPMSLPASPLLFGQSPSGIKNQLILSTQRAYFDNNVLIGPEYSYQKLYNNKHMNTFTIDIAVYM